MVGDLQWPPYKDPLSVMINAAPISQLFLTIQFEPAASGISVLDLAALRELFAAEYPVFGQIPRAGPMIYDPTEVTIEPNSGLPRLSFVNEDLALSIFFQDDRVSVGWDRTTPLNAEPNYPGFTATLERLQKTYDIVAAFLNDIGASTATASVGEVAYVDTFNLQKSDGQTLRLEELFTFYNSNQSFMFNQLNFLFRRLWEEPIRGMSETTVSGFYSGPLGEMLVTLGTTVRFKINDEDEPFTEAFRAAHQVSNDIFTLLVKPDSYAI
jgi:uncharacterized protein (TIGR04255 family)